MRRLVYLVAVTLDGFIAGPDGGDPSGQPYLPVPEDLLELIVAEFPETLPGPARAAMGIDGPGRHFDTVLEGRASYEVGLAAGVANAYPHLRHLVFSTTMEESPDPGVEVVAADPARTAHDLKAEDGVPLFDGPFGPHRFRPTDVRQLGSGVQIRTLDRAEVPR